MAKGYVLIDKIPETCIGCMFYDMGFCQAVGEKYISDDEIKHTPDWCPIHKLPNRKQSEKFTISPLIKEQYTEFNRGWNACLDEILNKNRE